MAMELAQFATIATVLVALYWVALIVGGGLILVSSVLGGHGHGDVDVHTDVDVDIAPDLHFDGDAAFDFHADAGAGLEMHADVDSDFAGDLHADADHLALSSVSTWFSLRFVVYFLAAFGAVGVVLTNLSDVSTPVIAVSALLAGVLVGQIVHQTIRAIRRSSGDSTTHVRDYVNRIGRVTIAVSRASKGEVAVHIGQGERYLPAMSRRADETFARDESVAVIAYRGGVAEVISQQEYEFLTQGKNKSEEAKGER